MNKVKSLILKGMLAGMTLVTGFGVVAPAMMNTTALAAEREVAGTETVYENYEEFYADFAMKTGQFFGKVIEKVDDYTYYVEFTDGVFKCTYTVTDVQQDTADGFKTEQEARKYADTRCWHNAKVEKDSETNEYSVTGDVYYGDIRMVKVEHKISNINMQCDNTVLTVGQDTPIFVTVDSDCDVTQLEVESFDESVASVVMSAPGTYVVIANNPGSTTISAHATDGSGTSSCVNICVSPQE